MNLEQILKNYKLHQQAISIVLGVIILLIASIFLVKYVKDLKNQSSLEEKTPTSQNQNETHIVTKGETLWSIAEKYFQKGSDWKKIADANNINDTKKIEIGQTLIIPLASPESSPESVSSSPSPSPVPQISTEAASTINEITENSYTVVKGDNLWTIALRAYGDGNKWHQIAEANHLKNPRIIHRGNVFTIPR